MADKRPGVRGPRGPQGGQGPQGNGGDGKPHRGGTTGFQRASMPALLFLSRLPRWILVVLIGSLFVLGVVLNGALAWLGALILALLGLLFGWLLVLSWPAINTSGKILRSIVVFALFGFAILRALGRF